MCYILNIETSSTNCSVSLSKEGKLIALEEKNNEKYSHSTKLHSFILDVLNKAEVDTNELSAISVSKGPGSYTGLRIGVAAAKGLCFALEIPLISISTLLILAKKIDLKSGLIIPVLDARRDEVYCSVIDSNFNIIEPDSPKIIINSSFEDYLKNNKLHFIGSGQKKCKELINPNNNLNFYHEDVLPSSKEMAELSYTKFIKSDFEDLAYFEPAYLKNFILDSLNR